ncbi:MAG: RidA family protein [Sphingobacteriales bacterium]|nr:MAG: RidA family protein [Sphingobacteriales bacterium]
MDIKRPSVESLHNVSHEKIQRLRPTPRWSDATCYKGIVHFVEVAADTEQDMTNQTTQILAQAESTLADIGSDKSRLLSATIYLTNIDNAAIFNLLWEAWLPAGCAPSRACLKVELLDPKMLVEIAFVAAVISL